MNDIIAKKKHLLKHIDAVLDAFTDTLCNETLYNELYALSVTLLFETADYKQYLIKLWIRINSFQQEKEGVITTNLPKPKKDFLAPRFFVLLEDDAALDLDLLNMDRKTLVKHIDTLVKDEFLIPVKSDNKDIVYCFDLANVPYDEHSYILFMDLSLNTKVKLLQLFGASYYEFRPYDAVTRDGTYLSGGQPVAPITTVQDLRQLLDTLEKKNYLPHKEDNITLRELSSYISERLKVTPASSDNTEDGEELINSLIARVMHLESELAKIRKTKSK